jgi:hypothetical protein
MEQRARLVALCLPQRRAHGRDGNPDAASLEALALTVISDSVENPRTRKQGRR